MSLKSHGKLRNGYGSLASEATVVGKPYNNVTQTDGTDEAATGVPSGSSLSEATVNLTKLCIGSGVMALPYAVQKGGLILSPIFLAVIAWWNYFSCIQMMNCKKACREISIPPEISSTYSRIAYCGSGWAGVRVTDACIIITLLGVCVTFIITFTSLLVSIPGNVLTAPQWALVSAFLTFPICCSKDVSRLVRYSFLGLLCLLVGMCVITMFGVDLYGHEALQGFIKGDSMLPLWPDSLSDLATFVGIATFGYGTCSLAFPVEESMAVPSEFPKAAKASLVFVWVVYALVGDGISSLFIYDSRGIASNILRNLPVHALSAHIVKLSMCAVCLLTFPLTFIPSAQMLEQLYAKRIHQLSTMCGGGGADGGGDRGGVNAGLCIDGSGSTSARGYYNYTFIGASDHEMTLMHPELDVSGNNNNNNNKPTAADMAPIQEGGSQPAHTPAISTALSVIHRLILMAFLQSVAVHVPCFGLVVSLLGCFTVSILSFVLPPLLSIQIITSPAARRVANHSRGPNVHQSTSTSTSTSTSVGSSLKSSHLPAAAGAAAIGGDDDGNGTSELGPDIDSGDADMAYYRDILLLVVGTLTTIVATAIVAMQCITDVENAEC